VKIRWIRLHDCLLALVVFAFMGCAVFGGKKSAGPEAGVALPAEKLDEAPQPIGGLQAVMAAIRYPEDAEKKNLEGVVMVSVLVDSYGRVEETRIAKSSGHPTLDDEALITVARVRWQPGVKDGKAINSWVTVPVEFHVE
jgi:TonB family protein